MSTYNLIKMQKKLKKYIDEARYQHTLGVMYTAAALAMCYGADPEQAQVAGLLHDCAKCIPNDKKLKLCKQHNIQVSEAEILSAITWHTTGKPEMTLLEKIIFISDYIEPMRNKAEHLPQIRQMAFHDLDMAVYMTLHDTILYLEKEKARLDNQSVVAYNYYKNLIEKKEA